jgi:hypothetical protein
MAGAAYSSRLAVPRPAGRLAAPRPTQIGTQVRQIPNFFEHPEVQQPQGLSALTQVSPLLPDLRPRLGLAYVGPL